MDELRDKKRRLLVALDDKLSRVLTHRDYELVMNDIECLTRVMYEQGRRDHDDIGKDAARRE